MSQAVLDVTNCANCAAPLHGEYCARCGQRVTSLNPTIHDVFHDLGHEVLHVDVSIVRTIRLLMARPGFLTTEWFEGRRIRYVSPLRLYLTFSVLAFAVVTLVPQRPVAPVAAGRARQTGGPTSATPQATASTVAAPAEEPSKLRTETTHMLARVNIVLVPLCAVMVMMAARKTRHNYPQHLYFTLHVHAFFFALVVLTWPLGMVGDRGINQVASMIRVFGILAYSIVAFRTVYRAGWGASAAKTVAVLAAYSLLVIIAYTATAFVLLTTGLT